MNKYSAKKTEIDGITFASKKEAARYQDLKLLERAGEIKGLELQPVYRIEVNGTLICRYTADFRYIDNGKLVIEDSKGYKPRDYPLRKKLMKAVFGIEIKET